MFIRNLLIAGLASTTLAAGTAYAGEVAFKTIATTHSYPEKAHAYAAQGPYFGVFGGFAAAQDGAIAPDGNLDFEYREETSGYFGLELGYAWMTPIVLEPAIEVEAMYIGGSYGADSEDPRIADSSTVLDFKTVAVMGNFVLNFNLREFEPFIGYFANIKPFIGAGAGAGYLWGYKPDKEDDEVHGEEADGWSLGYQFFAGAELDLTDDFGVYAEYKYLRFRDVEDWIKDHEHHMLGAGLRFRFE